MFGQIGQTEERSLELLREANDERLYQLQKNLPLGRQQIEEWMDEYILVVLKARKFKSCRVQGDRWLSTMESLAVYNRLMKSFCEINTRLTCGDPAKIDPATVYDIGHFVVMDARRFEAEAPKGTYALLDNTSSGGGSDQQDQQAQAGGGAQRTRAKRKRKRKRACTTTTTTTPGDPRAAKRTFRRCIACFKTGHSWEDCWSLFEHTRPQHMRPGYPTAYMKQVVDTNLKRDPDLRKKVEQRKAELAASNS